MRRHSHRYRHTTRPFAFRVRHSLRGITFLMRWALVMVAVGCGLLCGLPKRIVRSIGGRFFRRGESVRRGSLLERLAFWIWSPYWLYVLGRRWCGKVGHGIVSFAFARRVMSFGVGAVRLALLFIAAWLPGRLLVGSSRSLGRLVRWPWATVPAAVVAIGALLLLGITALTSNGQRVARYDQRAYQAYLQQDWEAAEVFYHRVLRLEPNRTQTRYRLGLVQEAQGKAEAAAATMQALAFERTPPEPAAMMWIAERLVFEPETVAGWEQNPINDRLRLARHCLRQVLQQEPDHGPANRLLGLLLRNSDPETALRHFQQLDQPTTSIQLEIVRLQRRLGMADAAQRGLRACRDELARELRQPQPTVELVENWVLTGELLGDFQSTLAGLEEHQDGFSTAQLNRWRSRVWLGQARWIYARMGGQVDESALEALTRALQFDPASPEVFGFIERLATTDTIDRTELIHLVTEQAIKYPASAPLHLLLGGLWLEEGDKQQAELALRVAANLTPDSPILLNNLACLHLLPPEPDLVKARNLIEQATELSDLPQLRKTRGEILLLQGDNQTALVDLEIARSQLPRDKHLLQCCVEASQALGMVERVDAYRQMLDRLDSKHKAEGG